MTRLFSTLRRACTLLTLLIGLSMVASSPAYAASVCKGKSKTSCSANQSCSYVKAHTRKNGAKVKAFCRAKPGKKVNKAQQSSMKKRTTKKSTAKKVTAKKTTAKKTIVKKTKAKKPVKKKIVKRKTTKRKTAVKRK